VFTIAAAIVWTTTYGFGSYGDPTHPTAIRIAAAQIAMLGITFAALSLAALFAERRRSEAALGDSDSRLRSILDSANVIAWDVDLIRNAVHSAGPVARLLHRSEDSVPRDFAAMIETIHPEDRDRVMSQFWTAVGTAATYRLEFRLNCDRSCWVTAEGSVDRDPDGRPVRVRGITHDITQRKLAEMALAEREAQLGLAGSTTPQNGFRLHRAMRPFTAWRRGLKSIPARNGAPVYILTISHALTSSAGKPSPSGAASITWSIASSAMTARPGGSSRVASSRTTAMDAQPV
jgi:PAS domain S-box-containing protein